MKIHSRLALCVVAEFERKTITIARYLRGGIQRLNEATIHFGTVQLEVQLGVSLSGDNLWPNQCPLSISGRVSVKRGGNMLSLNKPPTKTKVTHAADETRSRVSTFLFLLYIAHIRRRRITAKIGWD